MGYYMVPKKRAGESLGLQFYWVQEQELCYDFLFSNTVKKRNGGEGVMKRNFDLDLFLLHLSHVTVEIPMEMLNTASN